MFTPGQYYSVFIKAEPLYPPATSCSLLCRVYLGRRGIIIAFQVSKLLLLYNRIFLWIVLQLFCTRIGSILQDLLELSCFCSWIGKIAVRVIASRQDLLIVRQIRRHVCNHIRHIFAYHQKYISDILPEVILSRVWDLNCGDVKITRVLTTFIARL